MLSLFTPLLMAAALVACGSGSGSDTEPASAGSSPAPQVQLVANDCRSPNAMTTQRGCRPITRAVAAQ